MPHAKIATKQAKFTLEQLHAELGGRIIAHKAEASRLAQAMKHVEAVLKLLDPDYSVRRIAVRRRKPNPFFKRGTMLRAALNALRTMTGPATARDVALKMLADKGAPDPDRKAVARLCGAVQSCFRNFEGRGVVTSGPGVPTRWRLTEG